MTNFKQAYDQLNKEQKTAVDQIDGPVMVVAGPGTGKTQTIALRIANILDKTDTNPDNILALTFTDSGARAMRERLVSLIGTPAYHINISTFHSFCDEIIRNSPDFFSLDPSAEPLSDLERLQLIHKLIDDSDLALIRPVGAPHHYTSAIINALSDLKREGISIDEFSSLLDQERDNLEEDDSDTMTKTERNSRTRELGKNRELLTLYRAYQQELARSHRFDYDDMINSTVVALRTHPDFLLSLQERFQYLLVDEYQDTNTAQNELLLLLASFWGQEANIFVVGDPDQCVYRFSGASIENQLGFVKNFPRALVITLTNNYRSGQHILDSADSLISHNQLRINDVVPGLESHLVSQLKESEPLRLASLGSGTAELIFLAQDIQEKIATGISPSDIAVIYRTNKEASVIADALARYDIDYSISRGANAIHDLTIQNLVRLFRVIDSLRHNQEDEDLFTLLHHDIFAIAPLDILRVVRLAASSKLSLFDTISDSQLLDSLTLETRPAIDTTLSNLTRFSRLDSHHTFPETFELILNESGYLAWALGQPDSHHHVSRLNALFDEVKKMTRQSPTLNLAGFLDNFGLMEQNNLRLPEPTYGKSDNAIILTTAHSAKGMEWDHVYLYRAVDKHWGNKRIVRLIKLPSAILENTNLDEKDKNEEDRCLFYVAATRARRSLTISYATEYTNHNSSRATIPSMFVAELGEGGDLLELDTTQVEEQAHDHLETLLTTAPEPDYSQEERAFLAELVDDFALSPTSLNLYLQCPYKFKLDKLLKVPHSKKPHLAFGTAVHTSLEHFYQSLLDTKELPTKGYLLMEFTHALEREVLTKQDYLLRHKEGEKILSAYYDFFAPDFQNPLYLEKFFKVQLDDVTLTGKIDRIEWSSEKDRTIRVIDYKTGKGKTKGQIEGKTRDSQGDLKRQLVFYRLLIDLEKRIANMTFDQAELDFVSVPSDKGKSGRYSVAITREEVEDLKLTIRDTMAKIRALEFPRTSDTKHCGNCDFRDHCYPSGIPTQ